MPPNISADCGGFRPSLPCTHVHPGHHSPQFEDPEMPYSCYGHFYQMAGHNCRSTLEIVRNEDAPCDPNTLLDHHHQPEVVCVMMNPGASTPIGQAHYRGNLIDDPRRIMCDGNDSLVATDPDTTQNKITEMMNCRNLCHVRVLNLFDTRNTNSNDVLREIGDLDAHSIFSHEREAERRARINPETGIVVAAWGVDQKLQEYARRCVDFVNDLGFRIHGYPQHPYYHPSRKAGWLPYIRDNWPVHRRP